MKENKIKTTWNNINEKHPKLKTTLAKVGMAISFSVAGGLIGYKIGAGEIKIVSKPAVVEATNELVDDIIDEVS